MKVLPEIVVWYLLTFAGFSETEAHRMTCVAKYESGFNPKAVNLYNKNGTIDLGLFQINSVHWNKYPACMLKTLKHPLHNAKCARTIFEKQGYKAWVVWQKRTIECSTYKVGGVNE